MNAREVIAEALSTSYVVRSPSGRADAILAALTDAGYTVARLEQVGWFGYDRRDPEPTSDDGDWNSVGPSDPGELDESDFSMWDGVEPLGQREIRVNSRDFPWLESPVYRLPTQ